MPLDGTLAYIIQIVIPAAYDCLPASMASKEATALLLSIGLQESKFQHRTQVPVAHAHGFWQFERNGACAEVLTHPACKGHLASVLALLQYPSTLTPGALHDAITHNDILAAVCARLLLRTLPEALPALSDSPQVGWNQYLRAWRPGKPHVSTWPEYHQIGVSLAA